MGLPAVDRGGTASAEPHRTLVCRRLPGVYLYFPDKVVIVALAWSGDFRWHCDVLPNGSRHFSMGENLHQPLATSDYQSPIALVAVGADESEARFRLHQAVRQSWLPQHQPRGVHLNSWEAVYFDHNMTGLQRLIDAGRQAGADRFVLDDGWFGSRRDDTRDWATGDFARGLARRIQALG